MVDDNLRIENARIGFRNFSGVAAQFNPAGRRNFCVFLDDSIAKSLKEDGWNIRWLKPRDPEDSPQAYLQVAVSFTNPKLMPKIVMVTAVNQTKLSEETVNILDWAEIKSVDLVIRPYNWEANGKTGVKAYIKSMYVTVVEDEFEKKYRDVPDAANSSVDEGD